MAHRLSLFFSNTILIVSFSILQQCTSMYEKLNGNDSGPTYNINADYVSVKSKVKFLYFYFLYMSLEKTYFWNNYLIYIVFSPFITFVNNIVCFKIICLYWALWFIYQDLQLWPPIINFHAITSLLSFFIVYNDVWDGKNVIFL